MQEYLNMPLDAKKLQHESAGYLPRPLYVLFVQSSAYWEACDPNMEVRIHGDIEAAKAELETKANQGGRDFFISLDLKSNYCVTGGKSQL